MCVCSCRSGALTPDGGRPEAVCLVAFLANANKGSQTFCGSARLASLCGRRLPPRPSGRSAFFRLAACGRLRGPRPSPPRLRLGAAALRFSLRSAAAPQKRPSLQVLGTPSALAPLAAFGLVPLALRSVPSPFRSFGLVVAFAALSRFGSSAPGPFWVPLPLLAAFAPPARGAWSPRFARLLSPRWPARVVWLGFARCAFSPLPTPRWGARCSGVRFACVVLGRSWPSAKGKLTRGSAWLLASAGLAACASLVRFGASAASAGEAGKVPRMKHCSALKNSRLTNRTQRAKINNGATVLVYNSVTPCPSQHRVDRGCVVWQTNITWQGCQKSKTSRVFSRGLFFLPNRPRKRAQITHPSE